MQKRLGIWLLTGTIATGAILGGMEFPAQAQVRIYVQNSSPTPQRSFLPGMIPSVAPGVSAQNSPQRSFLPGMIPSPFYTPSPNGYSSPNRPNTIYNSTLINPTVINSNVVNSTLINPTVINSSGVPVIYGVGYPGSSVVVTNGLTAEALAILQANHLSQNYRTYTLISNGTNTFYVQVDRQPWTLLGGTAKYQLIQGIGSIYAPQGVSVIIESPERTPLGQYLCYAPGACTTQVLF